nr:hypothetical protein [Cypionkella sp.]
MALVLHHGEQAVLSAMEMALAAAVPTKTHVLNLLHRLVDGKVVGGPLHPFRAGYASGHRHDGIGRIARLARRIGGHQDRVADQIDLCRHRHVQQSAVLRIGDLTHQRQRKHRLQQQQRKAEQRMTTSEIALSKPKNR